MSTPMTAVAALPPPHYHHNHYPHHHSSPYSTSSHHNHQDSTHQLHQHQQSHSHGSHDHTGHIQHQQHHPHLPHPSSSSYANNPRANSNYHSPRIILPPPHQSPLSPSVSVSTPTVSNTAASASRLLPPYSSYNHHRDSPAHSNTAHQPRFPYSATAETQNNTTAAAHLDVPPRPPPHVQPYSIQHPQHQPQSQSRHESAYHDYHHPAYSPAMTTTTSSLAVSSYDQSELSRKRRRSREPNWDQYFKNGLPEEIIVIDDTPPPTGEALNRRRSSLKGRGPSGLRLSNATQTKRKREPEETEPHPSYFAAPPQSHMAHGPSSPFGSSYSGTERTSTVQNTTAPTSLSANGHHEDAPGPLKRQRTTRTQVADSAAKRRHIDSQREAFTYKPPPYPPKKAGDIKVRVVQDSLRTKHIKVDDDDGHYIVVPDADLTDRYQITRLLGQGTFGKVVQARDVVRKKAVAVKIIRSVQKYRDASRIELRVLATLKANDEDNRNRCIHLRDCFDYRGHICIVMDLLGQSVFDFLKGNSFVPFPNSQIQNFARQLFTSVAFLHDLNLIHTDLKPENILLCDNAYQTFTYNRKIPSSSTTTGRQATQRRVLLDSEIRLIDFGSATFQDEYHSSVVSTRHYRAPEIILGLGWSFPCDIWSIGCILVEFFTGDALFQTHDNLEHLAMMEAVVGKRIDSALIQQVNKMATRHNGNPASKYFKRLKLDYPAHETTRGSRRFVRAMKHLSEVIPSHNTFLTNFLDLLKKIFVYDPQQRITAKQALQHPWFKEMAQPDDGTEAAKIKLEREQQYKEASRNAQYVG